jgi:hypothetical protein
LAFYFLVEGEDAEQRLTANGLADSGLVIAVYLEGISDAVGCYFNILCVVGCQGSVFERGGQKVYNRQSEAFFRVWE